MFVHLSHFGSFICTQWHQLSENQVILQIIPAARNAMPECRFPQFTLDFRDRQQKQVLRTTTRTACAFLNDATQWKVFLIVWGPYSPQKWVLTCILLPLCERILHALRCTDKSCYFMHGRPDSRTLASYPLAAQGYSSPTSSQTFDQSLIETGM